LGIFRPGSKNNVGDFGVEPVDAVCLRSQSPRLGIRRTFRLHETKLFIVEFGKKSILEIGDHRPANLLRLLPSLDNPSVYRQIWQQVNPEVRTMAFRSRKALDKDAPEATLDDTMRYLDLIPDMKAGR